MRLRSSLSLGALLVLFPFLFSCSSLFYFPSRDLYYPPKKMGFEGREIPFKSLDGTQLYGWYFPSKIPPKGMLIQFHGNAENMSSHYLSLIWLVDQGYELFTFDYRGYGKSEGSPDQKGTYQDGLAALNEAWKLHEQSSSPHFIVIGQSLGGAIATRALADFAHQDGVSLLVLDSTFVSYRKVAREKLASSFLTWLLTPLTPLLISDEYSAEKALQENRSRLLVIHDVNDPAVPYEGAEDFFLKAHEPKEFWTLDQGGHVAAFGLAEAPYRARFVSVLDSLP